MFLRKLSEAVCCSVISSLWATIINVPLNQPTIQGAIDAAVNGDTVLVAADTYFENINFRGKGIAVASYYIFDHDPHTIDSTIINGSIPVHPDTASCVLIVGTNSSTMNDTSAALIGFTITGGTGTKWQDEHGAGRYTEGGGILIQYLSPRIKNNIIAYNEALDMQGVTSAGGGAIRCGDGNPCIANNVIVRNAGRYGGGIVLNYTGAIVRNNIIAYNTADGAYGGGGGIWTYNVSSNPQILDNNAILYNEPGGSAQGGGVRLWQSNTTIRNTILWGNSQQQILQNGGSVTVAYCDVQGGWTGTGTIDTTPFFTEENFYLSDSSPCIDAGDTATVYNDPEDPNNLGFAEWPSMGTVRNDMGAYGGPGRLILGTMLMRAESQSARPAKALWLFNYPNPFRDMAVFFFSAETRVSGMLNIYDAAGRLIKNIPVSPTMHGQSVWNGTDNSSRPVGSGVYIYSLHIGDQTVFGKAIRMR